jgi:hypothetical protein
VRGGGDRSGQSDWIERLRDVRLESGREDPIAIRDAGIAGQRDGRKELSVRRFVLPNLKDQRVPVLVRQADCDKSLNLLRSLTAFSSIDAGSGRCGSSRRTAGGATLRAVSPGKKTNARERIGGPSWRPTGEIGDGARDRHRLAACALTGADREDARGDGRRHAFSNAARPRLFR